MKLRLISESVLPANGHDRFCSMRYPMKIATLTIGSVLFLSVFAGHIRADTVQIFAYRLNGQPLGESFEVEAFKMPSDYQIFLSPQARGARLKQQGVLIPFTPVRSFVTSGALTFQDDLGELPIVLVFSRSGLSPTATSQLVLSNTNRTHVLHVTIPEPAYAAPGDVPPNCTLSTPSYSPCFSPRNSWRYRHLLRRGWRR